MNSSIPKLNIYSPTEERMTPTQRAFYIEVEKKLSTGSYIDVGDNVGYIFTYLYKVIDQLEEIGPNSVYENLVHISELYTHHPKVKKYCLFWAGESLLSQGLYEHFLLETENNLYCHGIHDSNLRLNLRYMLGLSSGWETDLANLLGPRTSTFIKNNTAIYKDHLSFLINDYVKGKGGWPYFYEWLSENQKPYPHHLFSGAPVEIRIMPDPIVALWQRNDEVKTIFQELCKEAENQSRVSLGLPAIGEGWISETELFKSIQNHFHQTEVVQHGKPHFLGRQHYDIWIPQWKVAVEFHGRQHFEAIDFFGGEEAFIKTVERDQKKIKISKQNNVHLFIVTYGYDLSNLLDLISETRKGKDFSLRLSNSV